MRHHDTNERGFVYWSRGVLGCGKNEKYIAPILVDGWRDENSRCNKSMRQPAIGVSKSVLSTKRGTHSKSQRV